jgi:uncharacterized membrane protein
MSAAARAPSPSNCAGPARPDRHLIDLPHVTGFAARMIAAAELRPDHRRRRWPVRIRQVPGRPRHRPAVWRSGACWRGIDAGVNRPLLAGPDGHPFHPLLVPLPTGAFVSSLIFDILTRTRAGGLPYLVDGAFWLIGIGLTGALVAAVPGVLDLRTIRRGEPAFAAARAHLMLNAAAAALFAIGYAWRAGDHVALDKTRWGQLALSAIAVAFLLAATWLGGKLTYYHGIRVTGQAGHQDGASRRR